MPSRLAAWFKSLTRPFSRKRGNDKNPTDRSDKFQEFLRKELEWMNENKLEDDRFREDTPITDKFMDSGQAYVKSKTSLDDFLTPDDIASIFSKATPPHEDNSSDTTERWAEEILAASEESLTRAFTVILWKDVDYHYLRQPLVDLPLNLHCDLAQFAIRLGSRHGDSVNQKISHVIRRGQREILSIMENLATYRVEKLTIEALREVEAVILRERWPNPEKPEQALLPALRSYLANHSLYQRFLSLRLDRLPTWNARTVVANTVIESIHHNYDGSHEEYHADPKVCLHFDWNLEAFLREQYGWKPTDKSQDDSSLRLMESVLTMTGRSYQCQFSTCKEYLELQWPGLGLRVLQGLKITALDHKDEIIPLVCGATMQVVTKNNLLRVQLNGDSHVIADVADILAWMSIVFRAPIDGAMGLLPQISRCLPDIAISSLSFKIWYSEEHNVAPWFKRIRGSTIALDYPIRFRKLPIPGLEFSPAIASKLLGDERFVGFDGRFFKGYSAMLIPISQSADIVHWFYIYNETGVYLDYSAADGFEHVAIDSRNPGLRHIIVWGLEAATVSKYQDHIWTILDCFSTLGITSVYI